MSTTFRPFVPAAAGVLVLSTAAAAQQHVEVSDDGRETVIVRPQQGPGASAARGDLVPFGLTPDWQNGLRRQVGGLQAADMNNDGLIDVVVGCYQSQSYPPYEHWFNYIYYNIGGELEADPSWISTDEVSTGDIQVADFNNDTYLDIFAANGGFAMADSVIYYGGPDGPDTTPDWFSNEPANAWNNYAKPFDIDHDGDIDVVTANQGNSPTDPSRPMFLFRNDNGVLDATPSWQSAESSLQNFLDFADYDGDGWEDLAVSKWVNYESGVYKNIAGNLQNTPVWTTGDDDSDKGIAWSDVNDDGWPDLALGHDPTQLFTNNAGTLSLGWSATASYFGHSELRFFDVDGDGDEDLTEVHFSNGHARIYLNVNGVLDSVPSWTFDSPHVGTAIAFGDINGNGRADLILGNSGDNSIMVFYAEDFDCPEDVNADGTVDVVDLLAVLSAWGNPGGPEDINGDGIVDVVDLLALLSAWGPC